MSDIEMSDNEMSSNPMRKEDTDQKMDYKCSIDIKFPSSKYAQNALEVLSVDEEIGQRITKSFLLNDSILTVNFTSKEAKMLRVAVSSFYDMLSVVLKVYQEFS